MIRQFQTKQAEAYQKDAIKENIEKTGQCNLQMARDSYMTVFAVMALQKNSPYTDSINKGWDSLISRLKRMIVFMPVY